MDPVTKQIIQKLETYDRDGDAWRHSEKETIQDQQLKQRPRIQWEHGSIRSHAAYMMGVSVNNLVEEADWHKVAAYFNRHRPLRKNLMKE